MSRPRLLFVHNAPVTFVTNDLALLRERYAVTEYYVRSDLINPLSVWRLVARSDLVFGWFASLHTLLPSLFARLQGKPAVIVLGGYDVAALPEIGYGHQRGGPRQWLTRLIFRAATRLLPVSGYNYQDARDKAGIPERKLTLVYNGVSLPHLHEPFRPERHTILTIATTTAQNLELKGIRLFYECARLMPDLPFVIVGPYQPAIYERLTATGPPNLTFAGFLTGNKLAEQFRQAAVYVQASRHESFGLAVAEAMSYGCVPVLSRAGALPEVGGDLAVYIDDLTPDALVRAIRQAHELAADPERPAACRHHVRDNFSLELRRRRLYEVIEAELKYRTHKS